MVLTMVIIWAILQDNFDKNVNYDSCELEISESFAENKER